MTATARTLSALLFALAISLSATTALAGDPEDLRSVYFHPTDPDCYAVSYALVGGGLILTCDDGASFQLLCASAFIGDINLDATEPDVVFTVDDHLIVGHFDGLFRGTKSGCGFERVSGPLGDSVVRDVVADPRDPETIYALTASGGGDNSLWVSTDSGASWERKTDPEPNFLASLMFAELEDGSQRMAYSVGKPNEDFSETTYFVRVSDDGGESFEELAFPSADEMRLVGIDRKNPDLFYALAYGVGEDRQTIYTNAAAGAEGEWERLGEVQALGSFVPFPDGGFMAVDVEYRRLVRSDDGTELTPIDGLRNISGFALRPSDEQAYVCRSSKLYAADAEGETPGDPLLDFHTLESFVTCEDPVDAQCQAQLSAGWCDHHFVDAPVCGKGGAPSGDAGAMAGDAGSDADDSDGDETGSAGGCSAVTPLSGLGSLAPALLVWLASRRRRRRA